jgi:non-heme chloroperoxidase
MAGRFRRMRFLTLPFANAGVLQAKLIPNAKLEVYKGAPHGLCTTMKDQVNEDLLAVIKA